MTDRGHRALHNSLQHEKVRIVFRQDSADLNELQQHPPIASTLIGVINCGGILVWPFAPKASMSSNAA